jgi:HD-like signal output (HDOD) protein
MTETSSHPSPGVLRHLATLSDLPADEIDQLSRKLFIHEDRKGTVLLALGAPEHSLLYLLEGDCKLTAADGAVKTIAHKDPSARAPIARLRPSRYQVEAVSDVRYLVIDEDLSGERHLAIDAHSALSLDSYEVEEEDDFGHMAAENRLTMQIYEDLNSDRLLLPSLPRVAVRIGEAVNDEHADARKVAALIETDPAIAVKLTKAANSARFGGVAQVATVTEAVARLGMQNTQTLVITFALRELFRTSSKKLEKRMFELWEHSRRIAALSRVLADKVGGFNGHEALLAGLVHDIGVLAVIGYARDFDEVADHPQALEASIHALRTQLSSMILSKWNLPREIVTAAKEAENWDREHADKPDYADIVIAAQAHEGIAGERDVAGIPALKRLGLPADEVGGGIELLHASHEEVAAAKKLLAG